MSDEYGRSALHYVCIDRPNGKRASAATELIEGGEDVNGRDENGWSPLHFAAQQGDVGVAEILIEAGADIDSKDANGNTPLWFAAMNSHHSAQVVNRLLTHGADPSQKNRRGVSLLEISPELFSGTIGQPNRVRLFAHWRVADIAPLMWSLVRPRGTREREEYDGFGFAR
ncbi:MAG TPA: ankyrin repeat domain-containing protein [Gammaproteobacteria bacterium]|nr:ankyrin repeat domain-containing protein [Gammaproteobacteria bacterium]